MLIAAHMRDITQAGLHACKGIAVLCSEMPTSAADLAWLRAIIGILMATLSMKQDANTHGCETTSARCCAAA